MFSAQKESKMITNHRSNSNWVTGTLVPLNENLPNCHRPKSSSISPLKDLPMFGNLSDDQRTHAQKTHSPQQLSRNKENFIPLSNKEIKHDSTEKRSSINSQKFKYYSSAYPSTSLAFNQGGKYIEKEGFDQSKPSIIEAKQSEKHCMSFAKNPNDSFAKTKSSNELALTYPNENRETESTIMLDESRVINGSKLLDDSEVKSLNAQFLTQKSVSGGGSSQAQQGPVSSFPHLDYTSNYYTDHKKAYDSYNYSTLSHKKPLNLTEESTKCNKSGYLSAKSDNLYDHSIWESFAKAYRNIIDEIKQDALFAKFNSQFMKYFNEKSILPSENFAYIIYDIKRMLSIAMSHGNQTNIETNKEKILKDNIATLITHNHQLIDDNTRLNEKITNLEIVIESLNEKLVKSELSTPRLYGEVEEYNIVNEDNNKNMENLIKQIDAIHSFYSDKLALISKSLSNENQQSYETIYKKLKDVTLSVPDCLNGKINTYLSNNIDMMQQIFNYLHASSSPTLRPTTSIHKKKFNPQTVNALSGIAYGNPSNNTLIDAALNTQKPCKSSMHAQTHTNTYRYDQTNTLTDQKMMNQLLLEKDKEIEVLRQRETSYQALIFSLSNQLHSLKK